MRGDLGYDGTIRSIKNASLSLDAEDEEVRWDVNVCIKIDFIVKSIRDSPRPSKTQSVPPKPDYPKIKLDAPLAHYSAIHGDESLRI